MARRDNLKPYLHSVRWEELVDGPVSLVTYFNKIPKAICVDPKTHRSLSVWLNLGISRGTDGHYKRSTLSFNPGKVLKEYARDHMPCLEYDSYSAELLWFPDQDRGSFYLGYNKIIGSALLRSFVLHEIPDQVQAEISKLV